MRRQKLFSLLFYWHINKKICVSRIHVECLWLAEWWCWSVVYGLWPTIGLAIGMRGMPLECYQLEYYTPSCGHSKYPCHRHRTSYHMSLTLTEFTNPTMMHKNNTIECCDYYSPRKRIEKQAVRDTGRAIETAWAIEKNERKQLFLTSNHCTL